MKNKVYTDKVSIGCKVLAVRKVNNLYQEDFAERLNVTQGFVSKIETGRRDISIDIVYGLMEHFNVDIEDFLRLSVKYFTDSYKLKRGSA